MSLGTPKNDKQLASQCDRIFIRLHPKQIGEIGKGETFIRRHRTPLESFIASIRDVFSRRGTARRAPAITKRGHS